MNGDARREIGGDLVSPSKHEPHNEGYIFLGVKEGGDPHS